VLLRSFAYLANSEPFPIAQNSLADRLRQTQQGASYIVKLLIGLEAITPAEKAQINRRAARYRWQLPRSKASQCNQLHDAPATDCNQGPPSDCNVIAAAAPLLNGAQKDIPQLLQVAGAFETD